ncbi:MAG: YbaK/EbsC family protein [Christensenellales bacterium]|jgi:prolyl-tRNA editing enzyme YbaK/EbsC (Cys-tRNA(Pro) deacylase)
MSVASVREYLKQYGLDGRVMEFETSSATVGEAALAAGVEEARIAKTLSFQGEQEDTCILIVASGDARIDNKKFKIVFGRKASMLSPDAALRMTGYAVGGVCPFILPENVLVYLDISLKRFDIVYPACGSANSAIPLSCDELFASSKALGWVDVCKAGD